MTLDAEEFIPACRTQTDVCVTSAFWLTELKREFEFRGHNTNFFLTARLGSSLRQNSGVNSDPKKADFLTGSLALRRIPDRGGHRSSWNPDQPALNSLRTCMIPKGR